MSKMESITWTGLAYNAALTPDTVERHGIPAARGQDLGICARVAHLGALHCREHVPEAPLRFCRRAYQEDVQVAGAAADQSTLAKHVFWAVHSFTSKSCLPLSVRLSVRLSVGLRAIYNRLQARQSMAGLNSGGANGSAPNVASY